MSANISIVTVNLSNTCANFTDEISKAPLSIQAAINLQDAPVDTCYTHCLEWVFGRIEVWMLAAEMVVLAVFMIYNCINALLGRTIQHFFEIKAGNALFSMLSFHIALAVGRAQKCSFTSFQTGASLLLAVMIGFSSSIQSPSLDSMMSYFLQMGFSFVLILASGVKDALGQSAQKGTVESQIGGSLTCVIALGVIGWLVLFASIPKRERSALGFLLSLNYLQESGLYRNVHAGYMPTSQGLFSTSFMLQYLEEISDVYNRLYCKWLFWSPSIRGLSAAHIVIMVVRMFIQHYSNRKCSLAFRSLHPSILCFRYQIIVVAELVLLCSGSYRMGRTAFILTTSNHGRKSAFGQHPGVQLVWQQQYQVLLRCRAQLVDAWQQRRHAGMMNAPLQTVLLLLAASILAAVTMPLSLLGWMCIGLFDFCVVTLACLVGQWYRTGAVLLQSNNLVEHQRQSNVPEVGPCKDSSLHVILTAAPFGIQNDLQLQSTQMPKPQLTSFNMQQADPQQQAAARQWTTPTADSSHMREDQLHQPPNATLAYRHIDDFLSVPAGQHLLQAAHSQPPPQKTVSFFSRLLSPLDGYVVSADQQSSPAGTHLCDSRQHTYVGRRWPFSQLPPTPYPFQHRWAASIFDQTTGRISAQALQATHWWRVSLAAGERELWLTAMEQCKIHAASAGGHRQAIHATVTAVGEVCGVWCSLPLTVHHLWTYMQLQNKWAAWLFCEKNLAIIWEESMRAMLQLDAAVDIGSAGVPASAHQVAVAIGARSSGRESAGSRLSEGKIREGIPVLDDVVWLLWMVEVMGLWWQSRYDRNRQQYDNSVQAHSVDACDIGVGSDQHALREVCDECELVCVYAHLLCARQ